VLAASPGHPMALVRLGEIAAAAGEDPNSTGGESAERARGASAVGRLETTEPDVPGAWLAPDEDPFPESDDARGESPSVGAASLGSGSGLSLPPSAAAAAPPPAPAAPPPPAPPLASGEGFDLAAELAAALDDASPAAASGRASDDGFQVVFDAFKRGVQKALGSGDHEAHYDLGIAYREMGLLDDAIAEFQSAMKSPTRRIDCLHMLGLCALAQSRAEEAVDLLSHALAAPDLAQDQELAIRFELGRAYASTGEVGKARLAWEKVAAVDPSFCEVGELLHALDAPRPAPAAEFENFGDLLAEAETAPDAGPAAEHESFDDLMRSVDEDAGAPADPRAKPAPPAPDPGASGRSGPPTGREPRPRRRRISFV
jgi:tetratricopeptide (TPR) repeat protein